MTSKKNISTVITSLFSFIIFCNKDHVYFVTERDVELEAEQRAAAAAGDVTLASRQSELAARCR